MGSAAEDAVGLALSWRGGAGDGQVLQWHAWKPSDHIFSPQRNLCQKLYFRPASDEWYVAWLQVPRTRQSGKGRARGKRWCVQTICWIEECPSCSSKFVEPDQELLNQLCNPSQCEMLRNDYGRRAGTDQHVLEDGKGEELSWFYLAIINIQLEKTQISARTPGHWRNRKVVEWMPLEWPGAHGKAFDRSQVCRWTAVTSAGEYERDGDGSTWDGLECWTVARSCCQCHNLSRATIAKHYQGITNNPRDIRNEHAQHSRR